MRKLFLFIFVLTFIASPLYGAIPVGGPEMSIPEESAYLKDKAVNNDLDRYEYNMNVRIGAEMDFVTKREIATSSESTNVELEGQNFMIKFSNNFYDLIEPYVKVGTSNLEVKWKQSGNNLTVETEPGFVWGVGAKLKLWELKNYGVKLTMDAQYRHTDLDIDSIGGAPNATKNEDFEISEWQIALLASKKLVLPMGMSDYYLVPYGGITFTSSDVDVSFSDSQTGLLFSTYNGQDNDSIGIVLGCDIMPSLLSWYLVNFELRLVNETAFTIGGTVKF